jgi:hypothetical protein
MEWYEKVRLSFIYFRYIKGDQYAIKLGKAANSHFGGFEKRGVPLMNA